MKSLIVKLVCICLLAVAGVSVDAAQIANGEKRKNDDNCEIISSNDAINRAKSKIDGKIVSVKLDRNGKNSVYRVRMLVDDKRIKNLTIKACR